MLPKGITGFYDRTQSLPPMLEEKLFDRFCYALARAHDGSVLSVDHDTTGKIFTPPTWSSAILPGCFW